MDLQDETDIITISDSDASPVDTGVHWDFGTSSSARRIQFTGHLKGIKEEDGSPGGGNRVPLYDGRGVNRGAIQCYGRRLAHLCHCLKTQSFPPPGFTSAN